MKIICHFFLALLLVATNSFAAQTNLEGETLKKSAERTKIVLIEPDIELERVLASGQTETRADWSEQGLKYANYWLEDIFSKNTLDYESYVIPDGDDYRKARQVRALHRAVGTSIINNTVLKLPTKTSFNWTLGRGAKTLAHNNADYGLFVFVRRGYGTAGRAALSITSAVLFGAAPLISYQFAFASLVDLKTGQIVWFNQLRQTTGDLRKEDASQKTIVALLEDFPQLDLPVLKRAEEREKD